MPKISDNIWFTRKARIQASERLLSNDNHSQVLLIFYSIVNTCLSVMLIKKVTFFGDNTDLMLVIMSVNILVTSLFVANKNFKGRALSLKAHYIELQRLYFDAVDAEEKKHDAVDAEEKKHDLKEIRENYTRLLDIVENHAPIDDIVFRVFNESNITTRKPSFNEKATAHVYKASRFILLSTLYFLPIIAIYLASLI